MIPASEHIAAVLRNLGQGWLVLGVCQGCSCYIQQPRQSFYKP
jgi:hypothetical protein